MDTRLEIGNLPKLTPEGRKGLKSPISIKEMELLMKNLSTFKERPGCHHVGLSARVQDPPGALAIHCL